MQTLYCQGEKGVGRQNSEVKCCTPGVTDPMVSRHTGTVRAACRALHRACVFIYGSV